MTLIKQYQKFDPWWLHNLPESTRQEVIDWLSHYVNVEHCAWFEYNGHDVLAKMYQVDLSTGKPLMSAQADPLYGGMVQFTAKNVPSIVQQFFEEWS